MTRQKFLLIAVAVLSVVVWVVAKDPPGEVRQRFHIHDKPTAPADIAFADVAIT